MTGLDDEMSENGDKMFLKAEDNLLTCLVSSSSSKDIQLAVTED